MMVTKRSILITLFLLVLVSTKGVDIIEINGICIDVLSARLCGRTTAGQWVLTEGYKCYCKKISVGLLVVVSKYYLVQCHLFHAATSSTERLPIHTTSTEESVSAPTTLAPIRCPKDTIINFTQSVQYNFFTSPSNELPPIWLKMFGAAPLASQISNSPPSAVILPQKVSDVDLYGTFASTDADNDFIGIVFSFKNPTLFYLMSWRAAAQGLERQGLTIQLVNSTDGLGGESDRLKEALLIRDTLPGQASTIYETMTPWVEKMNYRWSISHRPNFGTIRVQIQDVLGTVVIDSGCIRDGGLNGGQFGVYSASQQVAFNSFGFACNEANLC